MNNNTNNTTIEDLVKENKKLKKKYRVLSIFVWVIFINVLYNTFKPILFN